MAHWYRMTRFVQRCWCVKPPLFQVRLAMQNFSVDATQHPHETFSNHFAVQHVDITPKEEILHETFVQSNVPDSLQGDTTRRLIKEAP